MRYGLIGNPLGHSYSREIHERIGAYEYELKELKQEELEPFLKGRDFLGLNVTIPYKERVIPFLDSLSPVAREIGAVNTIVNRSGALIGGNTDYAGMCAALRRGGIDLAGKKVLVLGTGGTSHTACAAANRLGASHVLRVSRTRREGAVSYEEARRLHADAQVIINATPVGMHPNVWGAPIDISAFAELAGVMDVVYNPLRTDFVQDAGARGISVASGLYMLVAQAVYASAIFREMSADESVIEEIWQEVLAEKRNIVLIGMAGAGKSAIGREIARLTGRPLIDTDELIVEMTGMPIAKIFEMRSEAAFRDIERAVVCNVSARSGCVIATGGGAVLDELNIRALRHNGVLCHLERDPGKLAFSADRPLSSTRAQSFALYKKRHPLYQRAADYTVVNDRPVEEVAKEVIEGAKK